VLKRFDYLSTVSGGGYVGSFLGALLRAPARRAEQSATPPSTPAEHAAHAAQGYELAQAVLASGDLGNAVLGDTEETAAPAAALAPWGAILHPVRWLRESGRYLAPTQIGDWLYAVSHYLRSLGAVHFVAAVVVLAAFTALIWVYHLFGWTATLASPLWVVAGLLGLAFTGLGLAYWWVPSPVTGQNQQNLAKWGKSVLIFSVALGIVLVAGLWMTHLEELKAPHQRLGYSLAIIVSVVVVASILALSQRGSNEESARRYLTVYLSNVLKIILGVVLIAIVDTLGRWLYQRPGDLTDYFLSMFATFATIGASLRFLQPKAGGGFLATLKRYLAPLALAVAMGLCVLIAAVYAMVAYAAYFGASGPRLPFEEHWRIPLPFYLLTGFAVLACIGLYFMPQFLNLSTFQKFYAARISRAYLGAANIQRLSQQDNGMMKHEAWVQESHPNDLWTIPQYFGVQEEGATSPGMHCYPLHLINVTLNEHKGGTSGIIQRDRKGVIVSLGPRGMVVHQRFYSWQSDSVTDDYSLLGAVSSLKIGDWAAISGASFSTGVGSETKLGFAMLAAIFNARLGYWWSVPPGMVEKTLAGNQTSSYLSRVSKLWGRLRASVFYNLLCEMTAGFRGRAGLLWYLSDGGHFENTGAYELIRRRVPFIVMSDNGADPQYQFGDWANLVRKIRIDFGAETRVLDQPERDPLLPVAVRPLFGVPRDFQAARAPQAVVTPGTEPETATGVTTRPCAMLAEVSFDGGGASLLLVIKPALIDGLPSDLVDYAQEHPRFPQEPTFDQFFDEAQWESYRKLGESIGRQVFQNVAWIDAWLSQAPQPTGGATPSA
jgi:hypothetical protein